MKKLFTTLLLISTLVFYLDNKISISPFGVSFNLSPTLSLKLLLVVHIVIFIYWTLEEIKTNKIIGTGLRLFVTFRQACDFSKTKGSSFAGVI